LNAERLRMALDELVATALVHTTQQFPRSPDALVRRDTRLPLGADDAADGEMQRCLPLAVLRSDGGRDACDGADVSAT
jgi:hypothetical protein